MSNQLDVKTFRGFARLQDPYENATYTAKQLLIEPFKRQIYVAEQALAVIPDTPVSRRPSTFVCLAEAQLGYEILKLTTTRKPSTPSLNNPSLSARPPAVTVQDEGRNVLHKHGQWEAFIYSDRREKARLANLENGLVPECITWTVDNVIIWLRGINLQSYEETFRANQIDGVRLCILDLNRLVKLGMHDWDDLKSFLKEHRKLTGILSRRRPNTRDTSSSPLEDHQLYFDLKNVRGKHSETTSFDRFKELYKDVIWDTPEKTLAYPGMLLQRQHSKKFNTDLRF